jgi:hypothetical protein
MAWAVTFVVVAPLVLLANVVCGAVLLASGYLSGWANFGAAALLGLCSERWIEHLQSLKSARLR